MKAKIILLLCLMNASYYSQSNIDTLYLFPDTTTFINYGITVVEDISNACVRFSSHNNWNGYVVDKILSQFIYDSTQNQIKIYFRISTGNIPEEYVIYDNLLSGFVPNHFYPEWQEIKIEPEIPLINVNNIYISGDIPFFATRSYYYKDKIIPEHFLYWQSRNEWIEGSPCYYAIKVVIKKKSTSVKQEEVLRNYQLDQNFPNPFNSATKINFILAEAGFVQLKISDIIGRQILEISSEHMEKGEHSKEFKPGNINSGYYFYTLTVNGKSISKKMIYLK